MKEIYKLVNLTFKYGQETILEDVNLSIYPGDYIGIVGENGGGKTTLLRLLIGEIQPASGKIFFLGQEGIRKDTKTNIDYLAQFNPANKNNMPILAKELVSLGLAENLKYRPFLKKEEKDLVISSMDHLGVGHLADRNFHELSGGQKQRVLISKSLVKDAKVLILDEPTVGIDEDSKLKFYDILDHLNKHYDMTIIMVTHEIERVESNWNRTFHVKNHKVVEKC